MHLVLYQTACADYEIEEISRLVNSAQYFFTARVNPNTLPLTDDLVSTGVLEATNLIARDFPPEPESPQIASVILTSAKTLPGETGYSVDASRRVAIFSNHTWNIGAKAEVLRAVAYIIHIGMTFLLSHESEVDSCVCKTVNFDCLCLPCEEKLRDLGYRDGVLRLKNTFNWLNQQKWNGGVLNAPSLGAGLESSKLKLAGIYADKLSADGYSLKGTLILLVLHFLSDLIPFVSALETVGASASNIHLVAKPYPYSKRDEVTQILQNKGVFVWRSSKIKTVEACCKEVLTSLLSEIEDDRRILVIEDGGYFAPILHEPEFEKLLERCVGIVEQTQKGINEDRLRIGNPKVPILNVAESEFKKQYESPEIGRVAIQNISRFTANTKFSGRHAVIFGFGSVGQEVAFHLTNAFNMTVSVVEPKAMARCRAVHKKAIVADAKETFDALEFGERAALVVGTTGTRSITEAILSQLPDGAILVSTSSDQIEIDVEALRRLAAGRILIIEEGKTVFTIGATGTERKLTLLAEGYPINFYGSESVPNDTIDPIMTLLFICGVELTGLHKWKAEFLDKAVNDIVEKRKLVETFMTYA